MIDILDQAKSLPTNIQFKDISFIGGCPIRC